MDLLSSHEISKHMASMDLQGIEPFTLLNISWDNSIQFNALR